MQVIPAHPAAVSPELWTALRLSPTSPDACRMRRVAYRTSCLQVMEADVEAMQGHVVVAPEPLSANYRRGVPRNRGGGLLDALGGGGDGEAEEEEEGEEGEEGEEEEEFEDAQGEQQPQPQAAG